MAHPEQRAFVAGVKARYPTYFNRCTVLEIGSRDVNGSVRQFFTGCKYVGVDCVDGPGVDVVTRAHEFEDPAAYDTVITCETLEHDPYIEKTLRTMRWNLKPRGLFVATFAGPNRPEHGTTQTGEVFGPDPGYYRNLAPADFAALVAGYFTYLEIHVNRDGQDIYVLAM